MDWLSGDFCEDFANSSSITDIVDLVENSGVFEESEADYLPLEQGSSYGNDIGIQNNNENTNGVVFGPDMNEERMPPVADTTADMHYVSWP